MAKLEELNLGDLVYVEPYSVSSMRYQSRDTDGPGSGVTGYVNSLSRTRPDWASNSEVEILVPYQPANATRWTDDSKYWVHQEHLTILAKGTRKVIPGIDILMSPCLQMEVEVGQWEYRIRKLDLTHQGFSNLPTFLAWLYIWNDQRALTECRNQRRKDGTINPNKAHKIFYRNKLEIDPEAFELLIDLPQHIKNSYIWNRYKPKVNWAEVSSNL